jgi:hypothetical protein
MSEWSHLANAKHIDRIIAYVKANPTAWEAAWYQGAALHAVYDAARDAAYDAALDAAWSVARDAAYDVALHAAYDAASLAPAWEATRSAILALVAWDRTGGLMDLPAEQVKVLALLGDQAAILMYPAIAAMETTQELA